MSTISKIKVGGTTYDIAYPIGSIYLSVNDTSPAELFGGTWEQLKDRFLLGAGDTYAAGNTGGEAQHTLTVDELATHGHGQMLQVANLGVVPMLIKGPDGQGGAFNGGTRVGADSWIENSKQVSTSNSGLGTPHNNMPPYLAVYMWKRIA